jgi:hypothetical protein
MKYVEGSWQVFSDWKNRNMLRLKIYEWSDYSAFLILEYLFWVVQ